MFKLIRNSFYFLLFNCFIAQINPLFAADQEIEKTKARQSFVTLTIYPATEEQTTKTSPDGSGVIIDDEGHILTACHVINMALDEGWENGTTFLQIGANIEVNFIDYRNKLILNTDNSQYADVLSCDKEKDVAIIQLRAKPNNFDPDSIPIMDKNASYQECTNCLVFLGYPGHFEKQTGNSVGVENFTGQVTTETWHGYSGGPVYFKGIDGQQEWFLTGITIAGDENRPTTKYVSNYWAFDKYLGGFRERLSLKLDPDSTECSIDKFKLSNSNYTSQKINENPKDYIETLSKDQFIELIDLILNEDCRNSDKIVWARTFIEINSGKFYSELKNLPLQVNRYYEVIDKLNSIYTIIGAGDDFKTKKWREYNSSLYKLCADEKINPTKCWVNALRANERLWNWVLKYKYEDIDSIKKDFWVSSIIEVLQEWGDILYNLSFDKINQEAQTDINFYKKIAFIDNGWIPRGEEALKSCKSIPSLFISLSTLEKYAIAYQILNNKKKRLINNTQTYWADSKKSICGRLSDTIKKIDSLTKRKESHYFEIIRNLATNDFAGCNIVLN